MKKYIVQGEFRAGTEWEKFTKMISSQNEKTVVEKTYSLMGSEHGLKRNFVRIHSVKERIR
ncbi:MAG: 50S ribosomal protein L18Ae [Methanosarcinales archaeon Met12]|nr:MAG: 50S ribosomal protein L18Ae [Methanosarcinales archaeon Met12]